MPISRLVQLELIRESLVAVVDEMRANVIRASFSSIIYEGHDFSCAILTGDGRLVAQSLADHPIHSLSIEFSVVEIVSKLSARIEPGDIFLHNDPYTGGTHLNDVLMLYPVFHDGSLALFASVRCHWGDVGGMTAGSLSGQVTEIYQEGIRIVPTKICSAGTMNTGFLELMFNNMRLPTERRGDFNTMLGACRRAANHLDRLFNRFGGAELLFAIEEMFSRSERVLRTRLEHCGEGVFCSEGYVESNGRNLEPLVARLRLTVAGGGLIADFTGSSPQTSGVTNAGPAIPITAVVGVVKSFLDPHSSINHGSFAPIEVIAPRGTFLNARPPAPCGGMAEVKYLLDTVVAAAFGRLVPDMMVGDFKGTGNHVYISGQKADLSYLLYEWPAGGTGATRDGDGSNAVRGFTEGDFGTIHPIEVIESRYPLLVERCELRVGSCGDGQHRGGLGILREIRVLDGEASLSVLSEKNIIPPYGVAGGGASAPNSFKVVRNGDVIAPSAIPGKASGFPLRAGDLVREETAGGGGYGDPLVRSPLLVRSDLMAGYITRDQAKNRYGVVFTASLDIDEAATEKARNYIRSHRIYAKVCGGSNDLFDGPRRLFGVADVSARRWNIGDRSLIELCAPNAPSLRGWAFINPAAPPDTIIAGLTAIQFLGSQENEIVELRKLF